MSGDQANCNNKIGEEVDTDENSRGEASNRRFVKALTTLHKPTGKLFYIPGNHDAEALFDAESMAPINASSINLHNRVVELVPGLCIAGLGGSLPTKFKADSDNEWVDVFNPYPFLTEAAYTAAVNDLWSQQVEQHLNSDTLK